MPRCKNNFLFSLLLFFLFTSCVTTKAVLDKNYKETFRKFFIAQNQKSVIMVGKNYYYMVFDDDNLIKKVLLPDVRRDLFINTEKTRLTIDSQSNITGYVVIESFLNKLPYEEYVMLRSLGFSAKKGEPLTIKLQISGKRYSLRDNVEYDLPALDRTYVIPIYYKDDLASDVKKVLILPFAIIFDIIAFPFRLIYFTNN